MTTDISLRRYDPLTPEDTALPMPLFRAPLLEEKLVAVIKQYVALARQQTTSKKLLKLLDCEGLKLDTSYETFRKFAVTPHRGLDSTDDLHRMYTFFEFRPVGQALVRTRSTKLSAAEHIQSAATRPNVAPNAVFHFNPVGHYVVYHTAFLYPDAYTMRVMRVSEAAPGQYEFTEYLGQILAGFSQIGVREETTYVHRGVLKIYGKTPQFISHTDSQSLGFRCIVADKCSVRNGVAVLMVGRMLGQSTTGASYVRDVVIERLTDDVERPWTLAKLTTFGGLSLHERDMFAYLAENRVREAFADDALNVMQKKPIR